ncbi:MAG: type II toxin-antitoxin system RelE/ParE family toxin [Candidatus Electrothrix sp. GW3-4]|uniref:type II toxin-antitoxin system RelE family toxin n=1 Tax=Candidatus Electrothrix sp. GW3-4 TaxID=3126740 RepID=UPI0030D08F15
MSYELEFLSEAFKEWKALDGSVKKQFKKKLAERFQNPFVPAAKLSGSENRYKIKLRSVGYRLVYEVIDSELVVVVIAVGKRENSMVYKKAAGRRR